MGIVFVYPQKNFEYHLSNFITLEIEAFLFRFLKIMLFGFDDKAFFVTAMQKPSKEK